jgi:hypothetical protein
MLLRPSIPGDSDQPIFRLSAVLPRKLRRGFSLLETRHNFMIELLPRRGWFKPQAYLYTCARCKTAFLVNDPRDAIIPLDERGCAVPEPECSRLVANFALGPCDAFAGVVGEPPPAPGNDESTTANPRQSRLAS